MAKVKPRTFYNDNDSVAVAMLRELITDGLISDGVVDGRSITEVQADDLVGFTRCHFFAGSGAWEDALDIAGWPRHWNTWLASLPCQPWSCAGKGDGCNDKRHLWPVFFDLVNQCRPDYIIGEQVEAAVGKGWLDGVRLDLEGINYAFTFVVLPACCQGEEEAVLLVGEDGVREERVLVGPPHIRQRIFWGAVRVADVQGSRRRMEQPANEWKAYREIDTPSNSSCSSVHRLADMPQSGDVWRRVCRSRESNCQVPGQAKEQRPERCSSSCGGLQHSESDGRDERGTESGERGSSCGCCLPDSGVRNTVESGLEGCRSGLRGRSVDCCGGEPVAEAGWHDGGISHTNPKRCRKTWVPESRSRFSGSSPWPDYSIVICRDTDKHGTPKARRIPRQTQSVVFLGADGAPRQVAPNGTPGAVSTFPLAPKEAWKGSRVGLLRLAGNAIDPRTAAVFVEAFMETIKEKEGLLWTVQNAEESE